MPAVKKTAKPRLDVFLVEQGLASDVKEAQALILSGQIRVDGHPGKPGMLVGAATQISRLKPPRFVSRAGEKLAGALDALHISPRGHLCIDVGCSTGGFTDCLLKYGARGVVAVDVGRGLIDASLRADPRVHVIEGVNFRTLDRAELPAQPSFLTADVSFISLSKLFTKMVELLEPNSDALVMVKPQFEGTAKEAPGGIVGNETVRRAILNRVRRDAELAGFVFHGAVDSSVAGRRGNVEAFFHLRKPQ